MARNEAALKALEEEITAFGGTVMILPLDVTDFDALGIAFAQVYEEWGLIVILLEFTPLSMGTEGRLGYY